MIHQGSCERVDFLSFWLAESNGSITLRQQEMAAGGG